MSTLLTTHYQREVEKIARFGNTRNETALRSAFQNLLNEYCKQKNLLLIPELDYKTALGKSIRPDGTVKDALCLDWGYWESKDQFDNLDEEINKKFAKGYPQDNIIFEDSIHAVLFQQSREALRVPMKDPIALDEILSGFLTYERPEIKSFRQAIEQFKQHIPAIVKALREIIDEQTTSNEEFRLACASFLEVCRRSINAYVTPEDIREMLIQHILTEEIFITIFDETQFHEENNIAREIKKLERTFFISEVKRNTLETVRPYYSIIKAQASAIADHREKQRFLKIIYENFYKAYNPKGADRLGIVYTPNEIVRFMVESADYLLHKHFGRMLGDRGVEILDPATGTGTFITEVLNYLPIEQLKDKYLHEIHANEVAILPYYVANLNIEYTYKQRTGQYKEFKNICFVDTLDNTAALNYKGKQGNIFEISLENSERIKRQNGKNISVIMGNPPYNAKQENFNDQNANKKYPEVDKRLKETYIKQSTAQNKNSVYDMYIRFYRWAMDRVREDGIICLITNNSFINGKAFDGFRKCIQNDFQQAYVIDLGGNIRELSGKDGIFLNESNTIFGEAAAVGIAITFLIKDSLDVGQRCKLSYIHPTDIRATRDEKISYLQEHSFKDIPFLNIIPDNKNNWINQSDNDFDSLLSLVDKDVKAGKGEKSIFKTFSRGIASQRDEWVYDFSSDNLAEKMQFFVDVYQHASDKTYDNSILKQQPEFEIKWDRELNKYLKRGVYKQFNAESIQSSLYRPFSKRKLYFDRHFIGMTYQWKDIYLREKQNFYIAFSAAGSTKPFHCLATSLIADLHLTGDSQCIPMYQFDQDENHLDNITDWGLQQFKERYISETRAISKEDIFYYVYAVLHNPAYREKYAINLKRELPRIPFYNDFIKWRNWGKELMDLHIGYEEIQPYDLERIEKRFPANPAQKSIPFQPSGIQSDLFGNISPLKPKLKAHRERGEIIIDDHTTLKNIPESAWEYKLGNRSALEWVLDQYKESKPSDKTIGEKFNSYRFAYYKEEVIILLKKVCKVSVTTTDIVNQMNTASLYQAKKEQKIA